MHATPGYGGYPDSSFFGSSYRSPYPYHRRDYDVHKRIWDPYVNRPSKAQRFFEILSFLIMLAAVPCFLGGTYQIFMAFYAFFLGILGLFAWPRRHMVLWILCALLMIAALIVGIILRSIGIADCMPFVHNTDNFNSFNTNNNGNSGINGVNGLNGFNGNNFGLNGINGLNGASGNNNDYDWDSNWCGNRIVTYITHGILLGLITLALPFAIKIACERRRRFYDYDYVANGPVAATGHGPYTGHTAVYTPSTPAYPTQAVPQAVTAVPAVAVPVTGHTATATATGVSSAPTMH